ncbi:MAG: hypothetical protein KF691_07490 [Phycisphaeraceae bacterium]|nr:hypothetical protein [Phycisphaeraceae bacterium]
MRVQRWLSERMSLDADLMRGAGFRALLDERLQSLGLSTEDEYLSLLERSPEEAERIAGSIAVPETWFFRYPHSFGLLVEQLSSKLASGAASLRMMSIGCATGEEPYGMAMAAAYAGWPDERVTIDAIDRSGAVLERARQAEYGSFSLRHEIPAWAIQFLQHEPGRILVDKQIRAMVRFRRADALDAGTLGTAGADVVFCRNLLIYLSAGARARLLTSITDSLVEGGLLFVGHAEQMLAIGTAMKRLEAPHAFALERVAPTLTKQTSRSETPDRVSPAFGPPQIRRAAVSSSTTAAARPPVEVIAKHSRPEPGLEEARTLADEGRTIESEDLIRRILAKKGPSAPALELLGTLRGAANDSAGAKALFEQALYLEPARPTALLQLAMIFEKMGDQAMADRLWNRLRRVQPNGKDGEKP